MERMWLGKWKLKVLGKQWTVYLLEGEVYREHLGEDSLGMTIPHMKRVFLCAEACSEELLTHELTHAYLDELCNHATALTGEQMEEITCDLMAKHGAEILKTSQKLYKRLKSAL